MPKHNIDQYRSYEELPEDIKLGFKPVEGGFVRITAEENFEKALVEAHVERNVIALEQISNEKRRDIELSIEILGGALQAMPAVSSYEDVTRRTQNTIDARKAIYQEALEKLPRSVVLAYDIIRRYKIDTSIDQEFIADVTLFTDLYSDVGRDESYFTYENQYIAEALKRLKIRAAKTRYERGGEKHFSLALSGDRKVSIVLSEKMDKARFEFQPFYGFEGVLIGPEAVEKILGGKISADDYESIYTALISIKGAVGDVCRKYAEAVQKWAEALNQERDPSHALIERRRASFELMEVFEGGPIQDVPLNAIFYTVTKKFSYFANSRIPQPFES